MKTTAINLRQVVNGTLPSLLNITEIDASDNPSPDKWSKKEILGHLIDSACNNHQKFVRTMAQSSTDFTGYQQNHWVDSQKYNATRWSDLVEFWKHYNLHIAHIIGNVDPAVLSNEITIEGVGPFTLEFIMKDYAEHLKHHLKQILPNADLDSNFENVYNV